MVSQLDNSHIDNSHTFQVNGREVYLKRLLEPSEETQIIVKQYGFTPPRLDMQLKEYDFRIQEIKANMKEDRQTNLAKLAAGVVLIATPIILGVVWGPAAIVGNIGFFAFGAVCILDSLYQMSRRGERARTTIGEKQLQHLKQKAEEYLGRSLEYYKYQEKYLKDALDGEIAKGKNLENLRAAKEEIDLLCKRIAELRGEHMYPILTKSRAG